MSSRPLKFTIKDNLYADIGIDLKGKDYRKIAVEDINKSYKKMLSTQHPDKIGAAAKEKGLSEAQINEAVAAANEKMALANRARDILTDTNKRSQFDLHFSNYHHLTDAERAAKHAAAEKMNQDNIKKKGQEWEGNPNNRKSSSYRSSYDSQGQNRSSSGSSGSRNQSGSHTNNGSSRNQSSGNSHRSNTNGSNNNSQHSSSNNSWEDEFNRRYNTGQSTGNSSSQHSSTNGTGSQQHRQSGSSTTGQSSGWNSNTSTHNNGTGTHSSGSNTQSGSRPQSNTSGGGSGGGGTTNRSSYSSYESRSNKHAAFEAEKWIKEHPSETIAIGAAVIAAGGWALYELAKRIDEKNKETSPLPPR